MINLDLKKIGRDIQIFRLSQNISRQYIADELGVSEHTLRRIEMGRDVHGSTLLKLFHYADLKIENYLQVLG